MLLIVGKHDVVTCEKQIEIFNKDARNGKYIVFEESGHSPHYEEADRFAETVIHFEMKKRVLLLIRSILSKFLDM